MRIEKHAVVSIEYTLRGPDGNVIDTSEGHEPLVYMQGAGNIIPGLERELEGKAVGERDPDLLGLPAPGRPQAAQHPRLGLPGMRGRPGPRRQRGPQHPRRRRAGGDTKRLWRQCQPRATPGSCQ